MTTIEEPLDPRRAAVKVGLIQGGLVAVLWLLLASWNSRQTWLLGPLQQRFLTQFFLWELPLLGSVFAVVLPAFWIYRLADEATLAVTHETEFLERLLAYPRRVGVTVMIASALLFTFGAFILRFRLGAPAIEAAKVEVLGFVTGVLFGIASYFTLQPAARPALLLVVRQGAMPPARPSFPLTQKLFLGCVAIAVVVSGLFGQVALTWAERFAESRSEENARKTLRILAARAEAIQPRDAAAWKQLLAAAGPPDVAGTIAVLDSFGRLLATRPSPVKGTDARLLESEEIRESLGRLGNGSLPLRVGSTRVASSLALGNEWSLVALTPPDQRIIRELLISIVWIVSEALLISLLFGWGIGRGLIGALRQLEDRTRRFARDPDGEISEALPADDEIGTVSRSFTLMQGEIKRIQSRLLETEKRAATAELLAGVAHEVRNPLFGITSTASALRAELGDDARFREHFEVLQKESDRLARMMEEMLSLQRLPPSRLQRVLLRPAISDAEKWVRSRCPGRQFALNIECPEEAAVPNADGDQVRTVLTNLIENAVLSSSDDEKCEVTLVAETHPEGIALKITGGNTVTPEFRERIFEPFVTTRAGGTGVGLALCRRIVQEHGGTIEVDSEVGRPTSFTVRFASEGRDQSDRNRTEGPVDL